MSPGSAFADAEADGDDDQQPSTQAGELDGVLASLAAALLEDVREGHHDPDSTPPS